MDHWTKGLTHNSQEKQICVVMWSVCSNVCGCHTSVGSDQRLSRLLVLHQWHSGYQLSCWRGQEEEGRRWAKDTSSTPLTLPAWKAQMERTPHWRINDRCVWECVCMCNMGALNQTSSFRNPHLFTNSASSESYLRSQFMHALLIIYAVIVDQCFMNVNREVWACVWKPIRGFSHTVLYVYVSVPGCA